MERSVHFYDSMVNDIYRNNPEQSLDWVSRWLGQLFPEVGFVTLFRSLRVWPPSFGLILGLRYNKMSNPLVLLFWVLEEAISKVARLE